MIFFTDVIPELGVKTVTIWGEEMSIESNIFSLGHLLRVVLDELGTNFHKKIYGL